MTSDPTKPLCDHDVKEIVQFQEMLNDMGVLTPREYVTKYQEYLGLNDAEAAAYIKREESHD